MPRPSQDQDQALLAAGAELYPQLGCAGLSVRRVAEAAGVNPAMVHYHFGSKDAFLRALLQQHYEAMFSALQLNSQGDGDVMERLTSALMGLARFVREHRPLLTRVWADAQAGEAVAQDFLRANAPRHLGVLMALLQEAEAQGRLPRQPMLTRFSFLMGAVVAPLLLVGAMQSIDAVPAPLRAMVDGGVLSDEALLRRIEWALLGLASGA
ncbi:TetR/AcrR family transcriptional regulator [Roseateles cellulosilyticus]|uniref:TetR family transcriptional regulator n=1 Tax=Pelomonas cellulosilytica TaxID=2906762 RepID=A0ABS8XQ50_9BURK|nr:TetR family transcriptional regulator [Pelomonas sp. P8]MCE4553850.1 TetR family transcriptional regulator [Pelomonas sp. P8]